MTSRRGRSYAWALHLEATDVDPEQLTPAAADGLAFALELAEDARERSRDPRRWIQLEPLTLAQLAIEQDLPLATIARWIALARRQLFAELSDAGIYKRLQRQQGRRPRRCKQPGCTTSIPITAPANKKYCPDHASGTERVRRHRQQAARTQP